MATTPEWPDTIGTIEDFSGKISLLSISFYLFLSISIVLFLIILIHSSLLLLLYLSFFSTTEIWKTVFLWTASSTVLVYTVGGLVAFFSFNKLRLSGFLPFLFLVVGLIVSVVGGGITGKYFHKNEKLVNWICFSIIFFFFF